MGSAKKAAKASPRRKAKAAKVEALSQPEPETDLVSDEEEPEEPEFSSYDDEMSSPN